MIHLAVWSRTCQADQLQSYDSHGRIWGDPSSACRYNCLDSDFKIVTCMRWRPRRLDV